MKSSKLVLGLLALAVLGFVGYQYISTNQATNTAESERAQSQVPEGELASENLTVQNILGQSLAANAAASGKFIEYSAEAATGLTEASESYVIFFHANWCSWCRKREQEILENIDALPTNTKILKANFDEEKDLKVKYGVTQQDTFIFVDSTGKFTLKNGASLETMEKFFVESTVTPGEERPNGVAGYFSYDAETVATFRDRKPYALFFHASWCPPCRALDKSIKENLTTLPKNTNIFKVNYDDSEELKKLYGVNRQDTFVFFDKAGEVVKVQSGVKLDDITDYFQ